MTPDGFPGRLLRAGSFWELVCARAAATGDAPMLIDAAGHVVPFSEFKHHSERMSLTLAAQGIGPGIRVAWQLPTRVDTVILMAALARLGAVQAPVIPIYRERETGAAVATAGAEYMLVPGTWRGFDYAAMAAGLPTAPKVLAELDAVAAEYRHPVLPAHARGGQRGRQRPASARPSRFMPKHRSRASFGEGLSQLRRRS